MVLTWYSCGTHVVLMWYSRGTHVVLMWYSCGTHVVRMWVIIWKCKMGGKFWICISRIGSTRFWVGVQDFEWEYKILSGSTWFWVGVHDFEWEFFFKSGRVKMGADFFYCGILGGSGSFQIRKCGASGLKEDASSFSPLAPHFRIWKLPLPPKIPQ